MKKKVLFVNKFLYLRGGSERVMFEVARRFKELGHDVAFWGMATPSRDDADLVGRFQKYFLPHVDFRTSGGLNKLKNAIHFVYSLKARKLFARVLDEYRPDFVQFHNIYHQLTPSIFSETEKRDIPSTLVLHDYKLVCPRYNFIKEDGTVCYRCAETLKFMKTMKEERCSHGVERLLLGVEAVLHLRLKSYEKVGLFVSPSRFLKDMLAKKRFKGREDKIKVVYNRIDTNLFRPSWKDEGYILFYGRMIPEKGVMDLVRAYINAYRRGITRLSLVLVGEGPLKEEIERKYSQYPIICKGYMSGMELVNIIREASYIVMPSRWHENCPMTIIESMSCGKPVVARAVGGCPELVEDGKTGFLFKENSELVGKIALLENEKLREEMGSAARESALKNFSLDTLTLEDYHPLD